MKKYLSFILLFVAFTLQAQETYKTVKDISYISAGKRMVTVRNAVNLMSIIRLGKRLSNDCLVSWRRIGRGGKHIPEMFMNQGFAVVAVNYRLSPKAKTLLIPMMQPLPLPGPVNI